MKNRLFVMNTFNKHADTIAELSDSVGLKVEDRDDYVLVALVAKQGPRSTKVLWQASLVNEDMTFAVSDAYVCGVIAGLKAVL